VAYKKQSDFVFDFAQCHTPCDGGNKGEVAMFLMSL
jgi:hypothetical protein